GQRVRIRVGPGDVDEADAVIEQEGRVAQTVRLGALELVVDGPNELEVLLGPVGLDLVSGNHLVHLRASSMVVWGIQSIVRSRRGPTRPRGRSHCPPLASIDSPVIQRASSEARKTTTSAMSAASPMRPIAMVEVT